MLCHTDVPEGHRDLRLTTVSMQVNPSSACMTCPNEQNIANKIV